jgi:glycerol uptake facilitator-like aquaporin
LFFITLISERKKRMSLRAPTGAQNYEKVGPPAWAKSKGKDSGRFKYKCCPSLFLYAPYGQARDANNDNDGEGWRPHVKEIIANMFAEGVLVMMLVTLVIGIVSAPAGPDAVSRAIFVGMVYAASIYVALNWGYNDRLPRHLTPGATMAELVRGNINWFLCLLYWAVGFLFATAGAGILFATGASAIPIIGAPNVTSIGGVFLVQFLCTLFIAFTVLDQFTTKKGKLRIFGGRTEPVEEDNRDERYNSAYREDIGKRSAVYAIAAGLIVAFCFLKFGLFAFNGYVYYAGALAQQFLGVANPWAQAGATSGDVSGAAALFILTDVLAWIVAALFEWALTWMRQDEPRLENDDSSYGDEEEASKRRNVGKRISTQIQSSSKRKTVKTPSTKNDSIESHLNASDWGAQ